jgi:hypothetical protein
LQPYFEKSMRMRLTLLKWELGSPLGVSKLQSLITRVQNTLHWGILYIIGKLSKFRCRKWVRMNHLNICNTSYGKKKGRESNWQFDSRPPKVGNRPNPDVCSGSATCPWKVVDESYKFASNLILIRGLKKKLWIHKMAGV